MTSTTGHLRPRNPSFRERSGTRKYSEGMDVLSPLLATGLVLAVFAAVVYVVLVLPLRALGRWQQKRRSPDVGR